MGVMSVGDWEIQEEGSASDNDWRFRGNLAGKLKAPKGEAQTAILSPVYSGKPPLLIYCGNYSWLSVLLYLELTKTPEWLGTPMKVFS